MKKKADSLTVHASSAVSISPIKGLPLFICLSARIGFSGSIGEKKLSALYKSLGEGEFILRCQSARPRARRISASRNNEYSIRTGHYGIVIPVILLLHMPAKSFGYRSTC